MKKASALVILIGITVCIALACSKKSSSTTDPVTPPPTPPASATEFAESWINTGSNIFFIQKL